MDIFAHMDDLIKETHIDVLYSNVCHTNLIIVMAYNDI